MLTSKALRKDIIYIYIKNVDGKIIFKKWSKNISFCIMISARLEGKWVNEIL